MILIVATFAVGQQKARSHEQCIQKVPGDWGPNFRQSWHQHEARYWACRLGVPVETVEGWQKAAGEVDEIAEDVQLVTVDGKQLVIFVEMAGTAHCFNVKVLHREAASWGLL